METMGLRGIWGLEQLERTGLGTVACGLILLVTLTVINFPLAGLHFGFEFALVFGVWESFGLMGVIYLSRMTQADLEQLHSFDEGAVPSIAKLRPSRHVALLFSVLNLAVFWLIIAGAVTSVAQVGIAEFYRDFVLGRPGYLSFWYGAGALMAITAGIMWSVVIAQARALSHAARTLEVHVLHLDRCAHIAHPLVRIVVFVMVIVSLSPFFGLFIDDRGFDRSVALTTPSTVVAALILVLLYVYPVWLLRGRIGVAKQEEMQRVLAALDGDASAMNESRIGQRADGMNVVELLAYRQFVDAQWEWPVAPYVQRVVLVGLLPPLTWVLAGLVENAVGAMVGGS